jgi:hypothetical protein
VFGDLVLAALGIVVFSIPLALNVWALLDAARRPEWAFALVGRSRTSWVVLNGGGIFVCGAGVILAVWYLVRIRPVVADAESGRLHGA